MKERDELEDLVADGRTILKWVFNKCNEGMDLVVASQNSNRFRAFMIAVITYFFNMTQQPLVGQGLLIFEDSRSHSDPTHSVGLLWTIDHSVAETST